ncbi:MAG: RsmD family RNA methyltransferase [Candidatus Peribacteraceae bacterium]
MHSYAALLGHQPALSRAEFSSLLPDLIPGRFFGDFFTFQTTVPLDQEFLSRLGGTILLARKITGDSVVSLQDLPSLLLTELKGTGKKPVFSLRLFGLPPRHLTDLLRHCKTSLKKQGMPSRYVGSERLPPKAIQLHDEGLLDPKLGCELTVLCDRDDLWIGRTIAAQDVKDYTQRDIGKPVRDTTVGLLPPKLAQILLNFGEYLVREKTGKYTPPITVFDPFCGTGVIPLEALIRGHTVLASDLNRKAVTGTTKNIEWARKTYKILKKDSLSTVWKQDALKPFFLKSPPNVIVTEGSLGPALTKRPTIKDVEKMVRAAEELTAAFLLNCRTTLPGVPVAMTLPVWYAQKKFLFLTKIWGLFEDLGFRPVLPPHVSPTVEGHFSLLYRRPDQFVGREIVLLKPKG